MIPHGSRHPFLNARRRFMFKRTVECLFVIALLAGLLAGNAGATAYFYNIPDVRNLPKAECEKALKAKKYITEIIWVEVETDMYTQIGKCQGTEPSGSFTLWEEKNSRSR